MTRTATTPTIERPTEPDTRGSTHSTEDTLLLAGLLGGSDSSLAQAYRRHGRMVYQVAFDVLRRSELAEDVTQDIFVRLWQRPERFDPDRGSLGAFLKLDARGRAVDFLRSEVARAKREAKEQQLADATDAPATIEDEVMTLISSERIRSALDLLEPEEKAPIALAYFDGLSYRGVADALGLPEGTVKSRIRKGLERLRMILGSEIPALEIC